MSVPGATRVFAAALLMTAVPSCGDPGPDANPATVTITPSSKSLDIGQTTTLNASVKNAAGEVIPAAPVSFTSSQPSVATVNGTTGVVTAVAAGEATITATSAAITGHASITVLSPTLTKQSTDPTSVVAGATFGSEIRVRLRTGSGVPMSNVSVAFTVTAGGGTVASATVTTDGSGDAATVFTTGKTVGTNTVTATASGVTPVTFSIATVAGPPASVSFTNKVGIVNVAATTTPAVTTADANGNAVTGATLNYTSRSTAVATVSSTGVVTGVAAGQAVIVASGTAGADSMLVVVAAVGGPVLMSDLASFAVTANADVTATILIDMRASGEKLGSTSVKVEWDPALLVYQSNAAPTGGASPTVNTTSASTGVLTFSMADANGFADKVQLLKITFKGGAAGKTGTLKLSTTEVSGATTFASLTAKTTVVNMPVFTK